MEPAEITFANHLDEASEQALQMLEDQLGPETPAAPQAEEVAPQIPDGYEPVEDDAPDDTPTSSEQSDGEPSIDIDLSAEVERLEREQLERDRQWEERNRPAAQPSSVSQPAPAPAPLPAPVPTPQPTISGIDPDTLTTQERALYESNLQMQRQLQELNQFREEQVRAVQRQREEQAIQMRESAAARAKEKYPDVFNGPLKDLANTHVESMLWRQNARGLFDDESLVVARAAKAVSAAMDQIKANYVASKTQQALTKTQSGGLSTTPSSGSQAPKRLGAEALENGMARDLAEKFFGL